MWVFYCQSCLEEGAVRPVPEPVEHAAVEEGRRGGGPVLQTLAARIHREHDVEVLHHLMREPLVQLLVGVQHEALALRTLLALRHKGGVLVALEEARHLAVGEQRVHPLQEARVHHVRLVQDKTDLLVLTTRPPQHLPQVLVKILRRVLVVHLDLKDGEAVHPGDEAGEGRLARPRHPYQQEVSLRLPEDTVDAQDMIQHLVEENQRDVQLLLVEDPEAGLDVVAELLPVDGDVVLGEPVGVEDGAGEGALAVHVGEVLHGYLVHVGVCPGAFIVLHCGMSTHHIIEESCVADSGCLYRIYIFPIPDPNFFHPGSRILDPGSASKNLSILTQNIVLSS
jgi:hypothetical protein